MIGKEILLIRNRGGRICLLAAKLRNHEIEYYCEIKSKKYKWNFVSL